MTDYELFVLHDIAKHVYIRNFTIITAHVFNELYAHGNPMLADDDGIVWFYNDGSPFTVTICKCDGMYCCEVTNNDKHETGLFQHVADTPGKAWFLTRNEMMEV